MRNAIVAIWKETGKTEVYTSLQVFIANNTAYKYNTISNYTSRKKEPYETEVLRLVKCPLIGPVKL